MNLSLCRTSDHYLLLPLQWLSWDSLATKNVSSTHAQNFWKVSKSWWQKRCVRNYDAYILLEKKQTSLLGRLQKKLLEHNACFYVASVSQWRVSKPPNGQCPKSPKLLSNKLSKYYSNAFKKHQNITGTIFLNIILWTWEMFLHYGLMGLTVLHMFFMTRSTTFFSPTAFVTSGLLFFLIWR